MFMNPQTTVESNNVEGNNSHALQIWVRIYLHGLLAFIVLCAVAYVVNLLVPFFNFFDNRGIAVVISIFMILVAPPFIGSVVIFWLLPILGKKEVWRGVTVWEDRLISEITEARERAQIVIVDWPDSNVRTMGVLTSSFEADNPAEQLATVYIPTAPKASFGYVHVVPLKSLEMTNWTLKQWQLYQLSFGSTHPHQLHKSDENQ
jgi:uncharacterized membrane protein